MNTPNALTVLPGDRYEGDEPEGYMTRDAFVSMVESYVRRNELRVRENIAVERLRPWGDGFEVRSSLGTMTADQVVVATGNLNVPKWPALAKRLSSSIRQIDGTHYRSAAELPPGAVLVVGCGNTGGQIAEELVQKGRTVFLSTGRNGRVPRTYRGRDIFLWLTDNGRMSKPRTTASGRGLIGATHTISLQSLSAQGVILLGRLRDCSAEGKLTFDDSVADSARYADEMSSMLRQSPRTAPPSRPPAAAAVPTTAVIGRASWPGSSWNNLLPGFFGPRRAAVSQRGPAREAPLAVVLPIDLSLQPHQNLRTITPPACHGPEECPEAASAPDSLTSEESLNVSP